MTRKGGQETSAGIRPILLDLQGLSRDYAPASVSPFDIHASTTSFLLSKDNDELIHQRLQSFTKQLHTLAQLIQRKRSFVTFTTSSDGKQQHQTLEIPTSIIRDCNTNLDGDIFIALYKDWYTMIKQQHTLNNLQNLSKELQNTELEISIAKTNNITSLQNVKQRVEHCIKDREYKFEICDRVLRDICGREMGLDLDLVMPDEDLGLDLLDVGGGIFGDW